MDEAWLWLLAAVVSGLGVGVVMAATRRAPGLQERRRTWAPEGRDFRAEVAIHLRGDTMHVVPGDVYDHVLERSGECGCYPGTIRAIGARGRAVLLVDHHLRSRRIGAGLTRRG